VSDTTVIDNDVRLHIYRSFLANGTPPTVAETSRSLSMTEADATAAYQRLADGRVIVLEHGTHDVLMAAPLSAVPTPHRVKVSDGREYYANCIWDAMGVLTMLGRDGEIDTSCRDCNESLGLSVRNGALVPSDAIVHFAIPAADWWKDIVFT
jgi:hypothetical protein